MGDTQTKLNSMKNENEKSRTYVQCLHRAHTSIAEILYMIFVIISTQTPREIDAWRIILISFSFVAYELCCTPDKTLTFPPPKDDDKSSMWRDILKMKFIIIKFVRQNENETTNEMKKWNDFGLETKRKSKFPLFTFDALFGIVSGIKAVYLVYFVKFFRHFCAFFSLLFFVCHFFWAKHCVIDGFNIHTPTTDRCCLKMRAVRSETKKEKKIEIMFGGGKYINNK